MQRYSLLDILDPSEDQDHSSPHLRPATTTDKEYLENNGLSHPYPSLLQSPPPPSVSFSTAAATLTHGHQLTLSSSHLPRPSLPHLALAAGISPSGSRPAGVPLHPTVFSLFSSPSAPLHYLSAAAYFHSSAMRGIPDKQKATIEKAVDIVKEKKKKVVDTLTKVCI